MLLRTVACGVCLALVACSPSKNDSTSSTSAPSNPMMDIARDAVLSKHKAAESLRDPDGVKYRYVKAYKYTTTQGAVFYSFCGQMNAKNGFGGYAGYADFIATPLVLGTRENLDEKFDSTHAEFCNPANDAGEFAF